MLVVLAIVLLAWQTNARGGPPDSVESEKLVGTGLSANDFGHSVAMTGPWIIVGSPAGNSVGTATGQVMVFTPGESGWEYVDTLTPSDGANNDKFGWSVAAHGDLLAVGARGHDNSRGAVYVFRYNGSDWQELDIITANSRQIGAYFGASLSLNSDTEDGVTLVVGANAMDTVDATLANAGAAYVFTGAADSLSQAALLLASDAVADDELGTSIALSNGWIAAGAPRDARENPLMGAAYLYERPPTGWTDTTEDQKVTSANTVWNDYFATTVALDGSTLVAGAVGVDNLDEDYYDLGAAHVFELDAGTWVERAILTAPLDSFPRGMGNALAISGNWIVAGAKSTDTDGGLINGGYNNDGAVYRFEKTGAGWDSGVLIKRLGMSSPVNSANLGHSVAISNAFVASGAPGLGHQTVYLYDGAPPIITGLARVPAGDVLIDSFLQVSAVASDASAGGAAVSGAEYRLDNGEWQPLEALDGAFDEISEAVELNIDLTGEPLGEHEVCLRATGEVEGALLDGPETCESFTIVLELTIPFSLTCSHKPVWPQDGEEVTVTARSRTALETGDLITAVEVDRMEVWYQDNGQAFAAEEGPVGSMTVSVGEQNDSTFVYGCRALLDGQPVFSGWRRVQVGTPEGEEPIGISVTGPSSDRVDIVFIADVDSYTGPDDPAFLSDLTWLWGTGYNTFEPFNRFQHLFNFWISRNMAAVGRSGNDSGAERQLEPPEDWEENYAFADAGAIVHTDNFRDYARNGFFSVLDTSLGTLRHETGHRPFGLADEYSGDVITYETSILPNVYESLESCESDAPDLGRTAEDCREFESTFLEQTFWTSEPEDNDLMLDLGTARAADLRRIEWTFQKCGEGEC